MKLILAALFLGFVGASIFTGKLPTVILWLYLAASGISFAAYARDKSAAKGGRWRTAESTLHLFSLIGGWPGALAAQKILRHKSKKQTFQFTFWCMVAVNWGVLGWMLTSSGSEMLRAACVLLINSCQ